MIRIRKSDGSFEEVPEGLFVEFVDDDGNVAAATFMGKNHELRTITARSGEFRKNYEKLYGVMFIEDIVNREL